MNRNLDPLGYLLVVLGVVGIVVGLIDPLNARWALVPGIVLLIIGIVLWLVFGYGRRRTP